MSHRRAPAYAIPVFVGIAVCALSLSANAQPPNLTQLAHRIITQSAQVRPGEVVAIEGGKHTIPLMESLAIEAQIAGGMVSLWLDSDKVIRSLYVDVPDRYLSQRPAYQADLLRPIDVYITLPNTSDLRTLDAGVSAERLGKLNAASDSLTPIIQRMKYRGVNITYPTEARAHSHGVADGQWYVNMIWSAMNTDPMAMERTGTALGNALRAARSVRVTTPEGTDVTFAATQEPFTVTAGIMTKAMAKGKPVASRVANLPDGNVTIVPVPGSANGKVVVPLQECRAGRVVRNIRFTFDRGMGRRLTIGSGGSCYTEQLAASGGPTMEFSSFSIGLNPAMKPYLKNGAAYIPTNPAGMVLLGIGDNQFLGGNVKTVGNFGLGFTDMGATVYADGRKIVDAGRIAL